MLSRIVRFVNLLLAALLAGNEFGTWAAVHRALWSMPTPEHIKAEQALTRRFASIMPFWMVSVLVTCLPALALARRGGAPAFRLTLVGTLCFVAMLISTVRGNVPINNRTLELSPEQTSPEEWRAQGTLGSAARPARRPNRRRAQLASPGYTRRRGSSISKVLGHGRSLTSPVQETTRLEAAQVDQAVAMLARAFRDDPRQRYVIPDNAQRARVQPCVLGVLVRYCLPYGEVHTTPGLDGVACWLPPGSSMTNLWGMLRSGMLLAPLRLVPVAFGRFMVLSAYMDATRERVVSVPHWYLSAIGVEPSRQSRGIGGALLDPVLMRADADRLPCYLERQSKRNVRFHEKHGFKVSHEGAVRGLRIWSMLRTPQGPRTATQTQPEPPEKENS